ncbi:transglycosylase domain-containing protein, partial [candidate division WOR-3 bacterium]|nr:transglycosylase domain-containing protein [candidate division WOR-3 bacterium]
MSRRFVLPIIAFFVLLALLGFSRFIFLRSIENRLLSLGIKAKKIEIESPFVFSLKQVEFISPSRFEGGRAQDVTLCLSFPDIGRVKRVSVQDFQIPLKNARKPSEKGESNETFMRIPDQIDLKKGIIEFDGREIVLDSFHLERQGSHHRGFLCADNSFLTLSVDDSAGERYLKINSENPVLLLSHIKIDEFNLEGLLRNGCFEGKLRGEFSSRYTGEIEARIDDTVIVDFSVSPALVSIPGRGLSLSSSNGLFLISAENFYVPINPTDKFEVLDYDLSGKIAINFDDCIFHVRAESIAFKDLIVFSGYLCQDTVTFDLLQIPKASLSLSFYEKNIDIDTLLFSLGNSNLSFTGSVRYSDTAMVNVFFSGERIEVASIIDLVPEELLPNLAGLTGRGDFDLEGFFQYSSSCPESTDFGINSVFRGVQLDNLGKTIHMDSFSRPFCATVRIGSLKGEKIYLGPSNPNYVLLTNVPRPLIGAVLVCEDGSFFSHRGFSIYHIRRAMRENLEVSRYISGGSTITMQLARNLFLSDEKSLSRKLEEAVLTWQLEKNLTKNRILELYLNIIEFGPGIRGIGAASKKYFGVDTRDLNPLQCAYLASIIPNPRRYYRLHYSGGSISEYWHQKLVKIMSLELSKNYIDSASFDSFSRISLEF